jgi:hypothetical protein
MLSKKKINSPKRLEQRPHFLFWGGPAVFYGPICKLGILMLIMKISYIATVFTLSLGHIVYQMAY